MCIQDVVAKSAVAESTVFHTWSNDSFNGLFSRITWVSRYRKDKTSLDLNEARDGGVLGLHWHLGPDR